MKLTNKGLSHIEFIISFLIFLGFVIAIFIIFQPTTSLNKNSNFINGFELSILNYSQTKLISQTVKLEAPRTGCFSLDSELKNILVQDKSQDDTKAISFSGKLYILGSGSFYTIYSNEEFKEKKFNYNDCSAIENYELGLFREENILSLNKLEKLKELSESNYGGAKTALGIPENIDFSFSLRDSQERIYVSFNKVDLRKVSVQARDLPVNFFNATGGRIYGLLNIQIW